jgi:CHAT domain-containing protein/tetratricopeptide (TPR) repeat protein
MPKSRSNLLTHKTSVFVSVYAAMLFQLSLAVVTVKAADTKLETDIRNTARSYDRARKSSNIRGAIREGERLVPLLEKYNPTNLGICQLLLELSDLYSLCQEHDKQKTCLEKARSLVVRTVGKKNISYAAVIERTGIVLYHSGKTAEGHKLLEEAYALKKSLYKPDHPGTAGSLLALASLYEWTGDYPKAEAAFFEVKRIFKKGLPAADHRISLASQRIGEYLDRRGDYQGAAKNLLLAFKEYQAVPQKNAVHISMMYRSIGRILKHAGRFKSALTKYKQCLSVTSKIYGDKHPSTAIVLANIAGVYSEIGDYATAKSYLQKAIDSYKAKYGPSHRTVNMLYNDMGWLLGRTGDYKGAEKMLSDSLQAAEKDVGTSHPFYANTLVNLAVVKATQDDVASAVSYVKRANQTYDGILRSMMGAGNEQQKLLYLRKIEGKTNFAVWLGVQKAPENKEARQLALDTVLQRKGLAADALAVSYAHARTSLKGQAKADFDELLAIRKKLTRVSLGTRGHDGKALRQMTEREQVLQRKLSRYTADIHGMGPAASSKQVCGALPKDAVLLEYIRFRPHNGKVPKARRYTIPQHYAVCPITRSGYGQWIDLGPARRIDAHISAYNRFLAAKGHPVKDDYSPELYRLLIKPVEKTIKGKKTLIVSPDATLHTVPFAGIKAGGRDYLIDRHTIVFVSSARDVIKMAKLKRSKRQGVVLFGNPNYESGAPGAGGEIIARRSKDLKRFHLTPLPGTAVELKKIKGLIPHATTKEGSEASETALKKLETPRILHFATHGFFLPDEPFELVRVPSRTGKGVAYDLVANPENPLMRSGIALTGANKLCDGDEDGILTAMEAAGLDLRGTELVVLSACDTGHGKIVSGEGVLGLRRSLHIAGAEAVVMTLWSIDDEAAHLLMKEFYTQLLKGKSRAEALRSAQLSIKKHKKYWHPIYWASFSFCGNWRKLSWDGKVPSL